ncbi:MAG: hypothetical protein HY326_04305 [Chloroflexi bacterium]|nr:hypothetical protein [Chloroflexota bacterium]
MHDRPNAVELLEATRHHLETQVIPALRDPRLRFQTLVAANVLSIVEREFVLESRQLRDKWQRLADLAGRPVANSPSWNEEYRAEIQAMSEDLCQRIRAGAYDGGPARSALFDHLLQSAEEKLIVANPRFLARLRGEE